MVKVRFRSDVIFLSPETNVLKKKRCCAPYSPPSMHPSSVARMSPCLYHIQNGIKRGFGSGVSNQGILPHHTTLLSIFIGQLDVARWFARQVIYLGITGSDHSIPNNPIMQSICCFFPFFHFSILCRLSEYFIIGDFSLSAECAILKVS